jgi:hypothetical protein
MSEIGLKVSLTPFSFLFSVSEDLGLVLLEGASFDTALWRRRRRGPKRATQECCPQWPPGGGTVSKIRKKGDKNKETGPFRHLVPPSLLPLCCTRRNCQALPAVHGSGVPVSCFPWPSSNRAAAASAWYFDLNVSRLVSSSSSRSSKALCAPWVARINSSSFT